MSHLASERAFQGFWPAVVTGVASILSTVALIWFGQERGVVPSPVTASTVTSQATTTETATVTVTRTATVTATSSNSASIGSPASAATTYLDAFDPVEDTYLVAEAAVLGGKDYVHSLTNPMESCSQAGPTTWVVPSGAQRLQAEVGVSADAAEPKARVAFLVTMGSTEVFSKVFAVGEHGPLDVAITSGDRLTIETRFIPEGGFRGNCNTEAVAVWGDLRLLSG
jgi:hypothetical protein